ncbi:MAG TPA: hypothetical protein VGX03_14405 [Candidatus Binatia bacterium]|jgi:hypothetical protein|nr:hypothetical protein [Candidatus Binatia bacterium]
MGDQCTLTMTIRQADQPRFEELLRHSRHLRPGDTLPSPGPLLPARLRHTAPALV